MAVKELILDYSKWRCGYTTPHECKNQLGAGPVRLLNEEGYSCCIGQFSAQLGASKELLLNESSPSSVGVHIELFNKSFGSGSFFDTALTEDCIVINDDPETTPDIKISLLTQRLAKDGIMLKIINHPNQQ